MYHTHCTQFAHSDVICEVVLIQDPCKGTLGSIHPQTMQLLQDIPYLLKLGTLY